MTRVSTDDTAAPAVSTPGPSTLPRSPPAPNPGADGQKLARTAGRGGLAVAFAKVYFILVGLVQQIVLPRVLGLDGYGAWSTVQSVASIAYNPVVSTSIQGVSRAVAAAPEGQQPQAIRGSLRIHALFALPLAALFYLAARPIAELTKAPHVTTALEIMSGVMFCYALYTPLIGVANGRKKFFHQAGLDVLSATLRSIGLIVAGYWFATRYGEGIEGAALGFVIAASLTLFAALFLIGTGKAGAGAPRIGQHLAFVGPLLLGQVVFNLLLQADSLLLRRFAGEAALATGTAAAAADPFVGAYRATQLFSFLPYQLLIAVTFVLFPMLATAHRDGDRGAVAHYVSTGVRLALILAGLMISVTSGLSGPLLRLVFGEQAALLGTRAMQLLSIGFGAFAILGILTTVLNSLKRERASAVLTVIAFALVVLLAFLHVRGTPLGETLLWRMAVATSLGLGLATLQAAYLVKRTAGAVVELSTLFRVVAATTLAIILGRLLPASGKLVTPLYALIVAASYVLVLLVTRELGRKDLATLKAVAGRR